MEQRMEREGRIEEGGNKMREEGLEKGCLLMNLNQDTQRVANKISFTELPFLIFKAPKTNHE